MSPTPGTLNSLNVSFSGTNIPSFDTFDSVNQILLNRSAVIAKGAELGVGIAYSSMKYVRLTWASADGTGRRKAKNNRVRKSVEVAASE
jgi:hypothetical protein